MFSLATPWSFFRTCVVCYSFGVFLGPPSAHLSGEMIPPDQANMYVRTLFYIVSTIRQKIKSDVLRSLSGLAQPLPPVCTGIPYSSYNKSYHLLAKARPQVRTDLRTESSWVRFACALGIRGPGRLTRCPKVEGVCAVLRVCFPGV